jgi:hypothetical protein|tara:strand:+ start:9041 stop:9661 length:621 start_codon:yes stop_codon:yes gene_type:complete
MKILSHRGYWINPEEKNTTVAFERTFRLGFGTETDVRDCNEKIVISHDIPIGGELLLEDFLELAGDSGGLLALNIKSDGLASHVFNVMLGFPELNYFTFDMSVPDMRSYLDLDMPVYCRVSEVERDPPWLEECRGVWLDSFANDWYEVVDIERYLNLNKAVCVVSPELHGRDYEYLWDALKVLKNEEHLYLCTDNPEKAKIFFKGD